jgi:uncharacterized YccA/Bax inhibitor family protein
MEIQLTNKTTGAVESTPIGFSWTCFFFGGLVPIIRGDWGGFFKVFGLTCITIGIYHFVFSATYNKSFIKKRIMEGFGPADERAELYLKMNGLYFTPNATA